MLKVQQMKKTVVVKRKPALADTFQLDAKLTRQLHGAAGLMTASPEWFIQEALGSLIRSTHDDGTVRSDMQDNYRDDVKAKRKCAVRAVKGGDAK